MVINYELIKWKALLYYWWWGSRCLTLNCFGNPNPVFPDSDATETSTFSYYNGLYSLFKDTTEVDDKAVFYGWSK